MRKLILGMIDMATCLVGFGGVAEADLTPPGVPQWHFITHDQYGFVGQAHISPYPYSLPSGVATPSAVPVGVTWTPSTGAPAGCSVIYNLDIYEPLAYDPGGDYVSDTLLTYLNFYMAPGGGGPWGWSVDSAQTGDEPSCPNPPGYVAGPFRSLATVHLLRQRRGAFSNGWNGKTIPGSFGGTLKRSTKAGAWVKFSCNSCKNIAVVGTTGRSYGSARLYVDGVAHKKFSAHASTRTRRAIFAKYGWATDGAHTIRLVNLGTAGHPRIDVDGFAVLK